MQAGSFCKGESFCRRVLLGGGSFCRRGVLLQGGFLLQKGGSFCKPGPGSCFPMGVGEQVGDAFALLLSGTDEGPGWALVLPDREENTASLLLFLRGAFSLSTQHLDLD